MVLNCEMVKCGSEANDFQCFLFSIGINPILRFIHSYAYLNMTNDAVFEFKWTEFNNLVGQKMKKIEKNVLFFILFCFVS